MGFSSKQKKTEFSIFFPFINFLSISFLLRKEEGCFFFFFLNLVRRYSSVYWNDTALEHNCFFPQCLMRHFSLIKAFFTCCSHYINVYRSPVNLTFLLYVICIFYHVSPFLYNFFFLPS